MRKMISGVALGVLCAAPLATAGAATIAISCGAVGLELELCQEGSNAWAEQTGNQVQVISTPNSATERLALYQQILAAGSSDIDVYQVDVIWPGILASHFIDLGEHIDQETIDQHFPAIIENNTVDDALVAMPWFTDAGILYYRTDLLEKYGKQPPHDLAGAHRHRQGDPGRRARRGQRQDGGLRLPGQGLRGPDLRRARVGRQLRRRHDRRFRGCRSRSTTSRRRQALDLAATWIGTIAPEGVLNYSEEEARGVFQSGNSVFMRNWPYAWALGNAEDSAIKGKIGVSALPKGGEDGKHTGALGGWQLAVSKYSANAELGADLVKYLTSYDEQKRRAIKGAYNPTIAALYEDQEVLERQPVLRRALRDLHQRGGPAVQGDRRQVQPGELGVLQRRPRGAERQERRRRRRRGAREQARPPLARRPLVAGGKPPRGRTGGAKGGIR